METLVTGGGGFLGRHLVGKLLARGESVRVFGRRDYPDLAARGVRCIRGDLADPEALAQACAGVQSVFHVAAKAGIALREAPFRRTNVEGTANLLAACRAAGVRRLVYTSTPSVVFGRDPIEGGDESLPYPESHLTPYARTKAEAERAVLAADDTDGMRTCALRPHLIWGPGDTNLLPRLAARARSGRLARIGDGENRISVSYVENVADAHLAAADRLAAGAPVGGKAYFINEPEPVRCWDFIARLLDALGLPPVRRRVPLGAARALGAVLETAYRLARSGAEPPMSRFLALQLGTSHWFRIDRAREELGWTPAVGLDEGLRRLAASPPPGTSAPAPRG